MKRSSALGSFKQALAGGLIMAAVSAVSAGCIDDRPSGPGRIRDEGGATGSRDSSGGSTGSAASVSSPSSASGGQTGGAGLQASSAAAGGAGHAGTTSSARASSSGAAGQGGASASSQSASALGSAGQGGTSSSVSSASSGGNSGTGGALASSGNRDAGVPRDTRAPADAAGVVSFANQIQPMLKANCVSCHGPSRQNAGVRLDSYSAVKTNAKAAGSAISSGVMPPTGGLSADLRQLFQTWVDQGALNN